jgi:hypothetical protein
MATENLPLLASHTSIILQPHLSLSATRVPIVRKRQKHMVYGYAIEYNVALEHGSDMYGPASSEHEEDMRVTGYVNAMKTECKRHWCATGHCAVYVGQVLTTCITFAGNMSQADMELPPQEVIEKLRDVLQMDEGPQWFQFVM